MEQHDADAKSLITDPFLLSILQTSLKARTFALSLLSTIPASQPETSQSLKHLLTTLSHLRTLNRRLALALRATKAETSTSRAEIDTLHLNLQNLYYESRHLRVEIHGCQAYPHAYADLPMVDEKAFTQEFPEWRKKMEDADGVDEMEGIEIEHPLESSVLEAGQKEGNEGVEGNGDAEDTQKNESQKDDNGRMQTEEVEDLESALMRARIEHEYQVRVELEEERKRLVAKKLELVKENAKRKEELQQLDGEMEAFIKAAEPIQHRFEKEWS